MVQHLTPGKILLVSVSAHATLYLAFSFLPYGFGATIPCWCRKPYLQRIPISHVLRRSRSMLSHAYQWDPCPWTGLLTLLPDPIFSDPRFLLRLPAANNNSVLFQLLHVPAGDRMLSKHNSRLFNVTTGWDGCGPFLSEGMRCINWNTSGLVGSVFSRQRNREFKLKYLKRLFDTNNIICLQEVHGKGEYRQAIQVLATQFQLFGTFISNNENAGGSAICVHRDILPEEAFVTHLITCQGPDHLVRIQSERHNLVIVNVHFEPERSLRQLRGRLHLIHPHWPSYPSGVGIILGDFNICDPEEGRFNVWNQTSTDGDPRKTAAFHSYLPHVLEIVQPDYTRRDSSALGVIRALSRIDRIFINLPMAEARDFHCYSQVFENLVKESIPSDHAPVRLVIQKPTRGHQSKRIPSWMSKHPIFCSILQQLHDDHRFSTDPFCALADFKVLLHKAKKMTKRELSRQTPDCIGAKLLITSTALRAYRNRHLGTLMRCF